ncbi:EpsG family protein [Virgibacillus sp. NKC19-3]|uniref:EpsG family protein n=1 Tax=Virgibacillus saliphilus TaxID=2831674 RepID=UPI001C9AE312|nr:EpsG family protein [Virgibacillus sp. NKC19-3]MBY7144603.1 EpsG family protein [Virgibacillus sp. NKC19-3]
MSIVQSYFLYYFIVIFTAIIVFLSEGIKKKVNSVRLYKIIFWSAILLPVLVSGFRYGIGTDFLSYERIYFELTTSNIIDNVLNTRYELGWIALNHLVELIFNDVKYLFIVSSLLIWVLNFKAIYDSKNKISMSVAALILLCTLYNPSFNMVRQSLAAAVLMLSVKPTIEKRPVKFLLTILIATSFHYTASIFLPVYLIVNTRIKNLDFIKKIIAVVGFTLSVILAPKLLPFIASFETFSSYNNYHLEFNDFGIGNIILKLPVIIIILVNLKKLKINNSMYKLVIIYFLSLILEYYGYLGENISRIAIYYEMMQVFILSAIVKVQNDKYGKLFYSFLIVLYFIGWFTYNIIILNYHQTIPYIWI